MEIIDISYIGGMNEEISIICKNGKVIEGVIDHGVNELRGFLAIRELHDREAHRITYVNINDITSFNIREDDFRKIADPVQINRIEYESVFRR